MGDRTIRLVFVVHSLSAGGAQRVICSMANHWSDQGWDVSVITLAAGAEDRFRLHPSVRRVALDLMRDSSNILTGLWRNCRRIYRLRQAIISCAPDVVISFVDKTNVLTLLAARNVPVIVAERTDPRHHSIGRLWSWLRRRTYGSAAAVVVQTENVRRAISGLVAAGALHVVPNAVSVPKVPLDENADRGNYVVGMGRLSPEKGFDLLIDAWKQVENRHPGWTLRIYGEGPEHSKLEQVAARASRVELPGWTARPTDTYLCATIFVLPSRYEGFPNALLEAMACGVPAISFDCESGPAEIIRHEVDGLLVPPADTAALAAAIDRLISDTELRNAMGQRARDVVERFSVAEFYESWEKLCFAAAARRSRKTVEGN
jgi:GalNAc-alpha-(1->4)-GalNAc-alpha-(1->3)-diNAcBac-PP-undecaprenol alpha-1,4-N-acetyl-D-galactosaminyltransferase